MRSNAQHIYLEYAGGQLPVNAILSAIRKELKAKGVTVSDLSVYIQPETNMVYYTVDGKGSGEYCRPLDAFFA